MPQADQSDWDGVYYDYNSGEFFVMDIREDCVALIDAFIGEEHETLDHELFAECSADGDFQRVSQDVVRDPTGIVEELLYEAASAASGGATKFHSFSPTDVDFAITATNLSVDEDAPYRDVIEGDQ